MKDTRHPTKQLLALFPASLLKDRRRQRRMADRNARDGYLLISAPDNPKQAMLMERVRRALKRRGLEVSVMTL